jgi:hypothetical protein
MRRRLLCEVADGCERHAADQTGPDKFSAIHFSASDCELDNSTPLSKLWLAKSQL